jgi:alkanesulfonate monooxygenase SsuD/methylene tetrahydromethanopterin reductase-like flavin-dependent oxidoreductase (luciferase family)
VQVTGDGMVEVLAAGAVQADVVGGPADAECLTARGQFADQAGEGLVVGVTASLSAQLGHAVVGGAFPVGPEVAGPGVEEGEPGVVRRLVRRAPRDGIDPKTQISRFEEAIGLVREAWSGAELNHQGRHFTATGKISPVPPGAELWLGAMSDGGVRRAGRFGVPWVTDPLHNINVMSEWTSLYRQAGQEYGTSGTQQLVLLRDGWVADSLAEVERVWWPCIRAEHWFYFKQIPRWVADREPFLAGVKEESDFRFETHRIDRLVAGSPDDCIEAITKLRDTLRMDYLIMSFRMAAGPAHEEELRCIRRFGRDVIPAFR